ncbi:hypothetical protein [Streptomyces sp. SCL15-4]|uniref:hypothetical protein n=1 Tax=Streptomyces sp. SCL15-4 TaxID=2967221 RepID=UPI0029661DCA|nr:hypothetical protein [Streptomyces sp. SCL15-4]
MTPAEEIRTAAQRLRTLATAASTDTDRTPTAHWHTKPCWPNDGNGPRYLYGDHLTRDDGRTISWPLLNRGGSPQRPSYMHGQHADYAAAMDPTVGLALADLLDDLADGDDEGVVNPWALAVARALNSQP